MITQKHNGTTHTHAQTHDTTNTTDTHTTSNGQHNQITLRQTTSKQTHKHKTPVKYKKNSRKHTKQQ